MRNGLILSKTCVKIVKVFQQSHHQPWLQLLFDTDGNYAFSLKQKSTTRYSAGVPNITRVEDSCAKGNRAEDKSCQI